MPYAVPENPISVADANAVNNTYGDHMEKLNDVTNPKHMVINTNYAMNQLRNLNDNLINSDQKTKDQFDDWKSHIENTQDMQNEYFSQDVNNVNDINSIEKVIRENMAEYNSFIEFNENTKHQINRLEMQLNALIVLNIVLVIVIAALFGYSKVAGGLKNMFSNIYSGKIFKQ